MVHAVEHALAPDGRDEHRLRRDLAKSSGQSGQLTFAQALAHASARTREGAEAD
jgi:hypothetical protein